MTTESIFVDWSTLEDEWDYSERDRFESAGWSYFEWWMWRKSGSIETIDKYYEWVRGTEKDEKNVSLA